MEMAMIRRQEAEPRRQLIVCFTKSPSLSISPSGLFDHHVYCRCNRFFSPCHGDVWDCYLTFSQSAFLPCNSTGAQRCAGGSACSPANQLNRYLDIFRCNAKGIAGHGAPCGTLGLRPCRTRGFTDNSRSCAHVGGVFQCLANDSFLHQSNEGYNHPAKDGEDQCHGKKL